MYVYCYGNGIYDVICNITILKISKRSATILQRGQRYFYFCQSPNYIYSYIYTHINLLSISPIRKTITLKNKFPILSIIYIILSWTNYFWICTKSVYYYLPLEFLVSLFLENDKITKMSFVKTWKMTEKLFIVLPYIRTNYI